jgi:hypothetical protein
MFNNSVSMRQLKACTVPVLKKVTKCCNLLLT